MRASAHRNGEMQGSGGFDAGGAWASARAVHPHVHARSPYGLPMPEGRKDRCHEQIQGNGMGKLSNVADIIGLAAV